MKRICYLFVCCFIPLFVFPQKTIVEPFDTTAPAWIRYAPKLTAEDSLYLMSIPPLEVPPLYKTGTLLLPSTLDNSSKPYLRPIFGQVAYECGQASGIGYNFTYEINRLRNLPANITANQYPTHFAWNFNNRGVQNTGVSYFETWEMLKRTGTCNVVDYGGMSLGGTYRWMTGYDKYYNGMHNRVLDIYSIDVSTATGLLTLKQWLYDHLEGSPNGGVASFYANAPTVLTLPAGTPEGGKAVIAQWASSANHAMTIIGYNDSIRYDYNGDGQYTNNIDINGDGRIDMQDWEIGGLKMANSFGTGWGTNGYAYIMYKSLAFPKFQGSFWNQQANVIKVKQTQQPLLTYKLKMKHTSREKVCILAGVSNNPLSTRPEHIMSFPVFTYQGGQHYMQGDTTEAAKTIEFGLDVTPLLSYVDSNHSAKYFLIVDEHDPNNEGTGVVKNFSIMDYTSGVSELASPDSNHVMVENDTTWMSMIKTVNYDKVRITTDSLPPAIVNDPYSYQLTAAHGTAPYYWTLDKRFEEKDTMQSFPMVISQQLSPSSNDNGVVKLALPFSFPFYGKKYDTIYIRTKGYILFTGDPYPWPYLVNEPNYFKNMKCIAPFMSKQLYLAPSEGDGLWYQGNANYIIIRWKTSIYSITSTTDLNFAVKIYPDGKIEYFYGNLSLPQYITWISGVSEGNARNWQETNFSNKFNLAVDDAVMLKANNAPDGMDISLGGVFSGTPTEYLTNYPVRFKVTDNNDVSNTAIVHFSTGGINNLVIFSDSVSSGGDNVIEYAETALLTVKIKNIGNTAVNNAQMKISTTDPLITLTDSIQSLGTINPGQIIKYTNAFAFIVSAAVPDAHPVELASSIASVTDTSISHIYLTAYAPRLAVGNVAVYDGDNNTFDPGETADLVVSLENSGGAVAGNAHAVLTTNDPYITINEDSAFIPAIAANALMNDTFNISVSPLTPVGHIVKAHVQITCDHGYSSADSVCFSIGYLGENYETGDFTYYPWSFYGNNTWKIDTMVYFQGANSARSGVITDNQESSMFIALNVLSPGTISFYKKVSSETNYDYLIFYIDGGEMGRWAGEVNWSKETFPINAGNHTVKWAYIKDYSVSAGSDAAWVDFIVFPAVNIVTNGHSINGLVTYDNNTSAPLFDAKVYLKDVYGAKIDSCQTSLSGAYSFQHVQNGIHTVVAENDKPWCGVDTADIHLIRKYLMGIISDLGDSLKLKAADVNNDGLVTAADTVLIHNRLNGTITSFPAGDWCFNPKMIPMNDMDVVNNIKGLYCGDVNGSGLASMSFTLHPSDISVCANSTATFTTIAPGANYYQWYQSADNGATWLPLINSCTYTGTNTNSLTIITADSALDNTLYRCEAMDINNCASTVSSAGTLHINLLPITYAGHDTTIATGTPIHLSGSPISLEEFSCQVYCDLPDHCTSVPDIYNEENVVNVDLNGASNATSTAPAAGYTDFTANLFTTIYRDSTYTLKVDNWAGGAWSEYVYAFIDWNRDGDFGETNEIDSVGSSTTSGAHTFHLDITVPHYAVLGPTRMRVINRYSAVPIDCGTYTYGETEDYMIEIKDRSDLAYTYHWTGPNGFEGNERDTVVNWTDCHYSGDYILEVTSAFGCVGVDTVNIFVHPPFDANAGTDTVICEGTCALLIGSGGSIGWWNTGMIGDTIIVHPSMPSDYIYTAWSAGCYDMDTMSVALMAAPVISLGHDTTLCNGDSLQLDAGVQSSYQWSTGATGQTIVVDSADGSHYYTVAASNANGCTAMDSILVSFTSCAGINDWNGDVQLSVYPNPADEQITIGITGMVSNPQLKILNAAGKVVDDVSIESHNSLYAKTIDVRGYAGGVYYLKLTCDKGVYVKKVVVL